MNYKLKVNKGNRLMGPVGVQSQIASALANCTAIDHRDFKCFTDDFIITIQSLDHVQTTSDETADKPITERVPVDNVMDAGRGFAKGSGQGL